MSIRELNAAEIGQVSGAGFLGNALYGAVSAANQVLNTPLISSVGQAFNRLGPVGVLIHRTADTGGYLAFLAVASVGTAFGGSGAPIPYHYNTEWR